MTDLGLTNDNTKEVLLNNEQIDDVLHVIAVISNPCEFKIRYKLTSEFIKRTEREHNIILYVVELAYKNQPFEVTEPNNKRHLQIRGEIPLWHKENMINLGVKYLLPKDWKAVAWIDADVEFESVHWAIDALKLLNGGKDFVQLFTHAIDMDFNKQIMSTFTSFGYQYCKNFKKGSGSNYWHPGFAWACNRYAYDKMGGVFEEGILGSGDNIMSHAFINKAPESLKQGMSQEYIDFIANFQKNMNGLKLGYVPGTIRHYFHGKKENRNYYGREDMLIKYKYEPLTFIKHNDYGLIIPTEHFPQEFLTDIMDYFQDRNEDEMIVEEIMSKTKTDKEVLEYKINFILHEFEKLKKKAGITDDSLEKNSLKEFKNAISKKDNNVKEISDVNSEVKTRNNNLRPLNTFRMPPLPNFSPIPTLPNQIPQYFTRQQQQLQQQQLQQQQLQQQQLQQQQLQFREKQLQYQQFREKQLQEKQLQEQLLQRQVPIQFNNRIQFTTQAQTNSQSSMPDVVPFSTYQHLPFNNQVQILKNQIIGNNHHTLKQNKLRNMGF